MIICPKCLMRFPGDPKRIEPCPDCRNRPAPDPDLDAAIQKIYQKRYGRTCRSCG